MKAKRFLLVRYGGQGDALFLTPVCRWLYNHGYKVDVAISANTAPLLYNNPHIDRIFESHRFGPMPAVDANTPANLIKVGGAWIPDVALFEKYPSDIPGRQFDVMDGFRSIESCSIHPQICVTQQSDYVNAYDQLLGWSGIDPTRVTPEEKLPIYCVTKDERKWAKKVSKHWGKFVMIQTLASSPARSYMKTSELVNICISAGRQTLFWTGEHWIMDGTPVQFSKDFNPMRATAALIEQSSLLVSSDTCVSHLSEALQIQHITFYTTVPAWTRSRDYVKEITIDSEVHLDINGEPCKCCVIGRDCIRRSLESRDKLSAKERELIGIISPQEREQMGLSFIKATDLKGKRPEEYFNVASPMGLKVMVEAAVTKWDSSRQLPAYCVENVDGRIEEKLRDILKGGA